MSRWRSQRCPGNRCRFDPDDAALEINRHSDPEDGFFGVYLCGNPSCRVDKYQGDTPSYWSDEEADPR